MKLKVIMAMVCAVTLVVVGACGGGASHPDKVEIEGHMGSSGGSVKIEGTSPQTWSVNVPAGTCWRVTFTNAAGEVVGTPQCGSGSNGGQVPAGVAHIDVSVIDCKDCPGHDAEIIGAFPYVFVRGNNGFDFGTPYVFTHIQATALSEANAANKASVVEVGGPGTVLPSGVAVFAFVQAAVVSGNLVVASSLPERFGVFTITVDGVTIADKAAGTNATVTGPGNGWATITSVISSTLFHPGAVIILHQTSASDANPETVTITF